MDFPRCKNADFDSYVRMPTDPPLFDPKVKILPGLCEEQGATHYPTLPLIVHFCKEMGR